MPNYLTDKNGREIEATRPLPVRDVGVAHEREAVSGETVTFVTGAAGFAQIVTLDKAPIANLRGDKVGSFWGTQKNIVLRAGARNDGDTSRITAVVETATTATVTVYDSQFNLEQLFEETAATRHHIIAIRDGDAMLYGWIGGIAATGNSYVINVHNAPTGGAQSWVGTLADFTFAEGTTTYEVSSYESSFAWVTGTILTREVEYQEGVEEVLQLDRMANGDFAIDYQRGRILYKKAAVGTSDTCNYSVLKSYITADLEVSDLEIGAVELKDATTDTRAVINAANTARAATDAVVLTQVLDENGQVVGGDAGPTAPQAQGLDAAGADAYVTVVTANAIRTHVLVSLGGVNDAIISLDSGVTDHFTVPANSVVALDNVRIASGATVQARNASAGNNYTNLAVTIW